MDLRLVTLPPDLIARCQQYGVGVVESYAAGRNRGSRALSSHGAEGNAILQATGKMAECAFCRWAGLNPDEALNWSGHSDPGFDALMAYGLRVDTKMTGWNGRCLIWPINKTFLLKDEPLDILVLVKAKPPLFQIAGWIGRDAFLIGHRVAGPNHKLDEGTWYMDQDDLWQPSELRRLLRSASKCEPTPSHAAHVRNVLREMIPLSPGGA